MVVIGRCEGSPLGGRIGVVLLIKVMPTTPHLVKSGSPGAFLLGRSKISI
jgi:hypothetical protein